MFPTRVGMNRSDYFDVIDRGDVPHSRGDEPRATLAEVLPLLCSPLAWG